MYNTPWSVKLASLLIGLTVFAAVALPILNTAAQMIG